MLSCSHQRSAELFTESINARGHFKGYPCLSYEEFLEGKCTSCPVNGCPLFGYDSIYQKGLTTGRFYLKTSGESPYLGLYKLHITLQYIASLEMTPHEYIA